MPAADHFRAASTGASELLETIVQRFETAWQRGPVPAIEDFLPAEPENRIPCLLELIHIDLERRLKAGYPARVEDYLARHPELAQDSDVVHALALAEWRLRLRENQAASVEEWVVRFPGLGERLRQELTWVGPTSPGPPDTARPPDVPGYDVLGVLGRGAMGVVYKARQVRLGRLVALKMIRDEAAAGELSRFAGEAQALARLRHPNVVQIYEVGACPDGPFISIEYVEGGTLARALADGPEEPSKAARRTAVLARAVHAAHQAGVIHRDLKPANVLLTADGGVKITDFGLAKRLDDTSDQTRTGVVMGTPSYMAPEQAAGRTAEIGPAADVWALGAILYECLTGLPPFRGVNIWETLKQVGGQDPVPVRRLQPGCPRDLETICLKCLEKQPARRYPDAAALADDLDRFLAHQPIRARPVGWLERAVKWARREPTRAALAAAAACSLVALLVGLVAFGLVRDQHARERGDANRKLGDALDTAEKNRIEAVDHRNRADRQAAGLVLDKGVDFCEQGSPGEGVLWLARGVEMADRSDTPADLRRVLRINLALWTRELCPLADMLEHHTAYASVNLGEAAGDRYTEGNPRPWQIGHAGLAFSSDSRFLLTCQADRAEIHDLTSGRADGPRFVHGDLIYSAAFSPDGLQVATAGRDGVVRIWDAKTGRALHALPHVPPGGLVRYTPGGKALMAAGCNSIRFWDPRTGEVLLTRDGWSQALLAADLSPDGRFLLVGQDTADATLLGLEEEPSNGRSLGSDQSSPFIVRFSPDGKTAVTAWGITRLWDTTSGALRTTLEQSSAVWGLGFSPDSKHLLTTELLGDARLWQTDTGHRLPWNPPRLSGLFAAGYHPDGSVFFTGGTDGRLRFWDATTFRPAWHPIDRHESIAWAEFRPDGRQFVTWGLSGVARVHDYPPKAVRKTKSVVPAGGRALAFSQASDQVLVALADGPLQVFDPLQGTPVGPTFDHPGAVAGVGFSPDGGAVLTVGADGNARRWRPTTGALVAGPVRVPRPGGPVLWSAAGDRALVGGALWDFRTEQVTAIDGEPGSLWFTPGGLLRVESKKTTVRITDALTGKQVGPIHNHTGNVAGVAVGPDGTAILVASSATSVPLWSVSDGVKRQSLFHQQLVYRVAFAPDGRRALTGSSDHHYRLWDPATGAPVGPDFPDTAALAFSPDGTTLAVADKDGVIRLWDTATGKRLGPPLIQDGGVKELALGPGGNTLRVTDACGEVWLWPVRLTPATGEGPRLVHRVQALTGLALGPADVVRPLTKTEWQQERQAPGGTDPGEDR